MQMPIKLYGGVRFVNRPCPENVYLLDMNRFPIILAMQKNGMYLDVGYLREFSAYCKGEEDRITLEVKEMTGYTVNLASPDQVAELLFRKIGIKPKWSIKLVASGKRETMDDETLESLKDYHPCIPMIQEFREVNKIRTGFCDTLPAFVDRESRIRGRIRATRVVTGRLSMTEPNLMAQPTRSDLGKRIRKAFKAPKNRMIGTIDLSQIQMRVVADQAQCMNLIDIFLRNGDVHSETASRMFNLPVNKLDKMRHRYPAKRVGFGVIFAITAKGLQDQLVVASDDKWTRQEREDYRAMWTEDRCAQMIADWYKVNHEIKDYMAEQVVRARRFKQVWSMLGRVRRVPGIMSSSKRIRADAEREAGNSPVQMGEVDVMSLGLTEIYDTIRANNWDCQPLLQVHDEAIFEGDDNLPHYLAKFRSIFQNAMPLDVPLESSYAYGTESWADLEK